MSSPQPAPETPNAPSNPVVTANQAAGSIASELSDQTRTLAMALLNPDQVGAEVLKGVVTAVDLTVSPPVCSMHLSGDETVVISDVRFMDSYTPTIDDTVLVVKQGPDLFALGTIATNAGTPSDQGWVAPTLSSGITTESLDPVMYRVIVDHGSRKVQLRGSVNIAATQTALWTMPTGFRPLLNKRPIIVARDHLGGSNVAQLIVNADGTMVLEGETTGVASVNGTSGGASDATTGTSSIGVTVNSTAFSTTGSDGTHRHWHATDWHPDINDFTDYNGTHQHTVGAHGHGMAHTHEHVHTHTVTSTAVAHPDWLSFNGIEYFL
jgi:hypothetical protein